MCPQPTPPPRLFFKISLCCAGAPEQAGAVPPPPYLIQQVAILAVCPQPAHDMADLVNTLQVQQQPRSPLSGHDHALRNPRSDGLLAQAEQPSRYDRADGALVRQGGI